MPEKVEIDSVGDFIITADPVKIDRYKFIEDLANKKIEFLKYQTAQQLKIAAINTDIADKDREITDLYRNFILIINQAEKDTLKSNNINLYNKLSKAFPDHFEKYIPTVTAEA